MYHNAKVIAVEDDFYILLSINDINIWCFSNTGFDGVIGEDVRVELSLFGDLIFSKNPEKKEMLLKENKISYEVLGMLDISNCQLFSSIEFDIDEYLLADFTYLDHQFVSVLVDRVNVSFI